MAERYKVLSVEERLIIDAERGTATLIVIRWKHEKGFLGTLELPREEFTEEKVRARLDAEAAKITKIFAI